MACKTAKAMERLLKKSSFRVEAASPEELAAVLSTRWGHPRFEWTDEVKKAIRTGRLVREVKEGKTGYRTLSPDERQKLMERSEQVRNVVEVTVPA